MSIYDLASASVYYPVNIFISDHITSVKTSCAPEMIWENSAGIT